MDETSLGAVGVGLLAAFVGIGLYGTLGNYWISLREEVSAEERARHRLISSKWDRLFFLCYAGYALAWIGNAQDPHPVTRWSERHFGYIATALLYLAFLGILCAAFCGYPILWSRRILRQPADGCSASLRQMAKITFALGWCAILTLVFLLLLERL